MTRHEPRARALRWVLAKVNNDRLAEAWLITEVGNTSVGSWFGIADLLAELLAEDLRDRDDVLELIAHRIDEVL
jgi:hypothetical protein